MKETKRLLDVKNLNTTFQIQKNLVKAVRGVDIHVNKGDILAV
ncbi:MAG: peptide ABC transporter ATP-binding protein, partial [Firmicutes bacterium]|nr:peptide ABC transporter ATP-binding protein [Candidatus Scybalomonas excrementavium]